MTVEQEPEGGRRISHAISGGTTSQAERTARAKALGSERGYRVLMSKARAWQLEWNSKAGMEQRLVRGRRPSKAFQLLELPRTILYPESFYPERDREPLGDWSRGETLSDLSFNSSIPAAMLRTD